MGLIIWSAGVEETSKQKIMAVLHGNDHHSDLFSHRPFPLSVCSTLMNIRFSFPSVFPNRGAYVQSLLSIVNHMFRLTCFSLTCLQPFLSLSPETDEVMKLPLSKHCRSKTRRDGSADISPMSSMLIKMPFISLRNVCFSFCYSNTRKTLFSSRSFSSSTPTMLITISRWWWMFV